MVQTRRRKTTTATATKRKSAKQSKAKKVSSVKKQENCAIDDKEKLIKLPHNLDRCKDWIQQQKREKLKVQLDDLDSNESDDETARDINLATISVKNKYFILLVFCTAFKLSRSFLYSSGGFVR